MSEFEPMPFDERITKNLGHDAGHTTNETRVVIEQRQPGRIRRGIKMLGGAAIATLVLAGGLFIAEHIDDFSFDSTEKTEVTAGPADSEVRVNQFVNLSEIRSTFPLVVRTSLDRPGFVNCDMKIVMKDKDEQVETITNTGIVFDSIQTVKDESGKYSIDVSGDMKMTPSSVAWQETPILFERDLAAFDSCFNMDEPNQAMDIAVTTALQAGQLAAACAVDSKPGKRAIYSALKQNAKMMGDIPAEVPEEVISVEFSNLDEQQDVMYANAVRTFDKTVTKKLNQYTDASKDHELVTNFDGIRDCSQHTFSFADN